jgi:dTMP kinase
MWSQRRDHWVELIIPTIESGNSVVCDRSDGSSYAYQVFGQGQSTVDLFWQLRKTCFAQFSPDLYIYLDIDPLVSLERRRQDTSKEMTAFDHAEIEKHHNVRAGFKEFISNPDIPGDTIDASQSREAVLADAIRLISVIL